jgi:predicted RNase H-like HicB family nuclease
MQYYYSGYDGNWVAHDQAFYASGETKEEAEKNLEYLIALGDPELHEGDRPLSHLNIKYQLQLIREAAFIEKDDEKATSLERRLWFDILKGINEHKFISPKHAVEDIVKTNTWVFKRTLI